MTRNNTQNSFMPLPNDLPRECLDRLVRIGLASLPTEITDEAETLLKPSFKHGFFKPSRHIPPIDHNSGSNMSPVEPHLFLLCRSMQNVQLIRGCGGYNKYICKYIAKIDEQNYVVVSVHQNANGKLVTKSSFLHNTKISRSAHNENELCKVSREYSRPQGRAISLMEMLHVMLKYPEVITDLRFIAIPTVPLELRSCVGLSAESVASDAASTIPEVVEIRQSTCITHSFRTHSSIEERIINDLRLSSSRIDRITQFSIRPPEFRSIFNSPGNYFRWTSTSIKRNCLKGDDLQKAISDNLDTSQFVDGLSQVVKIRAAAFPEIKDYIETFNQTNIDSDSGLATMILYFRKLFLVIQAESDAIPSEDSNEIELLECDLDFCPTSKHL